MTFDKWWKSRGYDEESKAYTFAKLVWDCAQKELKDARKEAPDEFIEFWSKYPNKSSKQTAIVAWNKNVTWNDLKPIYAALEWQIPSEQWTKDKGAYIPMASTYLNQRRWEDEPTKPAEEPTPIF